MGGYADSSLTGGRVYCDLTKVETVSGNLSGRMFARLIKSMSRPKQEIEVMLEKFSHSRVVHEFQMELLNKGQKPSLRVQLNPQSCIVILSLVRTIDARWSNKKSSEKEVE